MTKESDLFSEEPKAPTQEKPTEAEWETYKNEIEQLKLQIEQKATEILGEVDGEIWLHEQIYLFGDKLKQSAPNFIFYIAWHRLINSTATYDFAPWLDIPSPNSVREFCEKLMLDLDDKDKCLDFLKQK